MEKSKAELEEIGEMIEALQLDKVVKREKEMVARDI